jgi:hypothetical protein
MTHRMAKDFTKYRIKIFLVQRGKEGACLTDIVKEIGFHRSVIIDHLNDMRKTGDVIKEPENSKRGKYYLSHLDGDTAPYLFGYHSINGVFNNKSKHSKIHENIMQFLSLMTKKTKLDQSDIMALELFKLSNKIGALILSYLISALDPSNKYKNRALGEYPTRKVNKDRIAAEWVNDCITHMWGFLLLECRDCINTVAGIEQQYEQEGKEKSELLRIEKGAVKLAVDSYFKIYPEIRTEIYTAASMVKVFASKFRCADFSPFRYNG